MSLVRQTGTTAENPHEVMEHESSTPRLGVWFALTSAFLIGPFIFEEATVTGALYLNMLKNYAITQILRGCIFQQDRVLPHYASQRKSLS
jgi:hypothetical protein